MEIHGGMDDLPCVMGPDSWPGGYVVDLLIGSGARGSERKGQRGLGGVTVGHTVLQIQFRS